MLFYTQKKKKKRKDKDPLRYFSPGNICMHKNETIQVQIGTICVKSERERSRGNSHLLSAQTEGCSNILDELTVN